ncbi:MAG: hypothetical protein PHV23_01410 [Candidatus Gracilibacteria bacterium]|nr:hypothetical protein [Candidatus Gracilibacteria bacterium]
MDFINLSGIIDFFLQTDKQKHILLSAIILIFDFLVRYYFIQKKSNSIYSIAFALRDTILIGLFKELIDMMGFGEASVLDFVGDSIGFLFPIYLYFSYRESKKLGNKDIFNYTDDIFRHFFISLKLFKKETGESIKYGFGYFTKLIRDKINEDNFTDIEMFKAKNKSKKELQEGILSIKNITKIIKYFFIFIIYGTIDFLIELIKMPFFVLFKTFYLFFNSMAFVLNRYK